MIHDFIKMIDNIDFLYGFIYECANLIHNLYDYDNYDHLAIKSCSEFIMPIINITKKEHIKEYNEHIKDIIDNLESIKDIYSICSYLMNICCGEYFKLSQNECLEIKKFIDNNTTRELLALSVKKCKRSMNMGNLFLGSKVA